jgi:DNA-binding Xre family transcriptional regulator
MKTDNRQSLLDTLLNKLKPADLLSRENRELITGRIENLMQQTGWSRKQFAEKMKLELNSVRAWLSGTRDLTMETLTEICSLLGISIGDLLLEQA